MSASSGIITGRGGSFSSGGTPTAIEVAKWEVTRNNGVAKIATSTTAGGKATAQGINEWSLAFEAVLPAGNLNIDMAATLVEGALIAFTGKTADTGTGTTFAGSARIKSIGQAVPIDGGALMANVSAEGHLGYTLT
jgi:hypothetical protein